MLSIGFMQDISHVGGSPATAVQGENESHERGVGGRCGGTAQVQDDNFVWNLILPRLRISAVFMSDVGSGHPRDRSMVDVTDGWTDRGSIRQTDSRIAKTIPIEIAIGSRDANNNGTSESI